MRKPRFRGAERFLPLPKEVMGEPKPEPGFPSLFYNAALLH